MKYKRILLKLSGESLQGSQKYGLSPEVLQSYAEQIRAAAATGVQIGIVIGGGNIFRGLTGAKKGFDRVKGDQMGMLATIINSLALQSALEDNGVKAKVLTSIRMEPIGEYYSKARAIEYLEAGYVVIIGGGTSNPYFTTDSASALRGIEIEADVLVLVKSTGHILEQGAANQRGGVDVRVLRSPSEGGAGQTEAIGGGHDDLVALELHANAGQYRAVFFAGDGNARLVHGLNESRGIDLAEHGRYHGQIRVLGVGHELQGELRLAGRDGQRGAVGDQVRFLRTQRFGDIGQQLALNQYGTGFVNAGFDVVASGNLVVEGGELQRSVNGFQLDASENRVGGTCVDDSGGPGYGVGQGCGIDFDFHV